MTQNEHREKAASILANPDVCFPDKSVTLTAEQKKLCMYDIKSMCRRIIIEADNLCNDEFNSYKEYCDELFALLSDIVKAQHQHKTPYTADVITVVSDETLNLDAGDGLFEVEECAG